jgi:hypothetical protein
MPREDIYEDLKDRYLDFPASALTFISTMELEECESNDLRGRGVEVLCGWLGEECFGSSIPPLVD